MKHQVLVALMAAVIGCSAAAQETYVIDPVHSQPTFEVTHLNMSTQRGNLGKATGKVTLDRAAKTGSMDITIDMASVRTIDPRLDAAVKGEKFFNVEKFPTSTFKATAFTYDGDRVTAINGDLTLLGVTKPVSLKVASFRCGEQPYNKKQMCGGDATATFKRSDFGMTAGIPLTPSDEVKLSLPFEGYKE